MQAPFLDFFEPPISHTQARVESYGVGGPSSSVSLLAPPLRAGRRFHWRWFRITADRPDFSVDQSTHGNKYSFPFRERIVHSACEVRRPLMDWLDRRDSGDQQPGRTRDELIENLHSALSEVIAMNRAADVADVAGEFEGVRINLRNAKPSSGTFETTAAS